MSATLPKADIRGSGSKPVSYDNYIAGQWMGAASGRTFENRNPADTSDLVGTFAESGPEDVEKASVARVPDAGHAVARAGRDAGAVGGERHRAGIQVG